MLKNTSDKKFSDLLSGICITRGIDLYNQFLLHTQQAKAGGISLELREFF